MKDEDYKQCIESIENENSQELLSKMISSEIIALKSLNPEKLLYIAAESIAYLKLSNAFVNKLVAHHANCAINYVNDSSCSNQKKENITSEIIATLRLDIAQIRTDRNKEVARDGGNGKTKKDSDGKQKAKRGVEEWWDKWQLNPSLYKSRSAFIKAMLDKYDGILESAKVIDRWCTAWKKIKDRNTHLT